MPVPTFTAADYQAQLLDLCPVGPLWPRDPDTPMAQFLGALSPTYARLCARDANLLVDAFPVQPVELLPEWEATLGLPDPCAGPSPTLQQRQQQVAARFVASGGQSADYFISLAEKLGYQVTITQFAPFRAGRSSIGQPLCGAPWAFAWQVNGPTFNVQYFKVSQDAVGEPLAQWSTTVLQCEVTRLSPAHTIVLFAYGGAVGYLFSNRGFLCLSAVGNWPTSERALAPGSVYSNGRLCCVVPGVSPNPRAAPVYLSSITSQGLLELGGADMPWTGWTKGSGQIVNPGGRGILCVA
jgi:uncharacterized protein YmfQ (DUF2313 family)